MKILQFIQLNDQQRKDAIVKMAAISQKLNFSVFGVRGEKLIEEALDKDANPDSEFIFDEIDDTRVDVIYRENI
ncbi:MAG: hypothetical protein WKF89_11735 [Chitinophagaceae bacterium]